jgi:uncharacterized protein (TIGR02466 family)
MSAMAIQSWFPTFLYQDKLQTKGLKSFNAELLEQCHLVRETDPDGEEWSRSHYPNGYTSYGSITDLHRRYPHFEELSLKIDKHVKKFARHLEMDLQGGKLEMVSCWVNIMPANATHAFHIHPLSVISGTYYVSAPKGSGHIKFEDPRLSQFMAAPPKLPDCHPRNKQYVQLAPEPGSVVLFESWLRHEVPPNLGDGTRVSISFNYDWR